MTSPDAVKRALHLTLDISVSFQSHRCPVTFGLLPEKFGNNASAMFVLWEVEIVAKHGNQLAMQSNKRS